MADSRLAEIYRKELKTKGLLGALVSASGARMKEKSDIRNILPQTGISGAAFEKMFGKKYRYGENKDSVRNSGGDSGGGGAEVSKSMEEKITRLGVDMKIMAKNTVVLPAMARDMNLMRMNMQKMVKLSGGTPSNKSDMFFKRASDRETQYESQYKKNSLSPTSTNAEAEKGNGGFGVLGFLGGLVKGLFGGILHGITSLLSTVLGPLLTNMVSLLIKGGLILGIMALIGKYVLDDKFRESVNKIVVDLWSKVPEEFKKQLLVGGSILLGAIVVWKVAMFRLGIEIDKLRLKLLGINFGPGGVSGPGGRGRGGRRGGRGRGFGDKLSKVGKYGMYGSLGYGAYRGGMELYDMMRPNTEEEQDAEDQRKDWIEHGGDPKEFDELYGDTLRNPPEPEQQQKKELGFNTDTVDAAVRTGFGTVGAVGAAYGIKSALSKRKTPIPEKPGFLKTAEDKIAERGARQAKESSKWGRFLKFVEKKAPKLFARLGVKLATMGGLALVPVAGWVVAAFNLGFLFWDAWDLYKLWSEFSGSDEETSNPEVNDAASVAAKATLVQQTQQNVGFVDAEGVYHTGPAPTPAAAPQPVSRVQRGAPGGAAKRGGSPTAVANGAGDSSSRRQIEAYLGKAISDAEYDALLRVTGAEAASNPMERAAVASVILNRAKRANGDIFGVLNAPYQFQAVTGPDGKSGTTDNPHSSNARKVIPGIEKQIADNIALVPRGLDSFTSAIPAAYGDVGGNAKYQKKMAEMQAHGGQRIGQSVFASMGGSVQVASAPNTGDSLTYAQNSLSSFERMLAMSPQGGQVINNNTTNTVMGGGQNSGRNVNPHNADLMKYIISQVS